MNVSRIHILSLLFIISYSSQNIIIELTKNKFVVVSRTNLVYLVIVAMVVLVMHVCTYYNSESVNVVTCFLFSSSYDRMRDSFVVYLYFSRADNGINDRHTMFILFSIHTRHCSADSFCGLCFDFCLLLFFIFSFFCFVISPNCSFLIYNKFSRLIKGYTTA